MNHLYSLNFIFSFSKMEIICLNALRYEEQNIQQEIVQRGSVFFPGIHLQCVGISPYGHEMVIADPRPPKIMLPGMKGKLSCLLVYN